MENKKRSWVGKNPLSCPRDLPREACNILKNADGVKKPAVTVAYMDRHEGIVRLVHHKAFEDLKNRVPSNMAKKLKPVTFDS